MADWKKTKCCGTCAHWNIERMRRPDGTLRVTNNPAECQWQLEVPLPASIWYGNLPRPTWMCRDYGAECKCWVKRELHPKCK